MSKKRLEFRTSNYDIFQASLLTEFAYQNLRSHSWFLPSNPCSVLSKSGLYQNRIQLELNHFSPLLPLLPDYHGLSQDLKSSWLHSDGWIMVLWKPSVPYSCWEGPAGPDTHPPRPSTHPPLLNPSLSCLLVFVHWRSSDKTRPSACCAAFLQDLCVVGSVNDSVITCLIPAVECEFHKEHFACFDQSCIFSS